MKKFLIILSLIISLFINVTPVYAMDYAVKEFNRIQINVTKVQYEDPDFIFNNMGTKFYIEVYNYQYNTTVYYAYSSGGTYYYSFRLDDNENNETTIFVYDTLGEENLDYDIYILNSSFERVYYLHIDNASSYKVNFSDFVPYTEVPEDPDEPENSESTESTDDTESTESTEEPVSPDGSGSTEGGGSQISQGDINILHNDLMILIILIGFFEFIKMVNIIVRNMAGGDK